MNSSGKKGEKGKSNSSTPMLAKDPPTNAAKTSTKVVEFKAPETSGKALDQLNPKLQPTAEQLRIAQMISDSKRDDPDLPDKVNKVVELTNCSADAAIIALHDSNNDLDRAIAALLDGTSEGDWEVSGKKRKPKQPAQQGTTSGDEIGTAGNGNGAGRGRDRERSRSSRGGPPRLRGRGRGRENKENFEDNEGQFSGSRGRGSRGGPRMSNGPGREGSGGRGGRGGRGFRRSRPHTVDNWEDGGENSTLPKVEPWEADSFPSAEDWDNEEYIGSLVETKVFTPSQPAAAATPTASAATSETMPLTNGSSVPSGNLESTSQVLYSGVSVNNSAQQVIDLNALLQNTAVSVAGAAASAQQQYLHYTQQATDALKAAMGVATSTASSGPAAVPSAVQQQPPKSSRPQRAKIPPPSKIPLSAVEMPDDSLVSGLDVKFGTLDFGIEPSGFEIGLDVSTLPSSSGTSNQVEQKQPQAQQQSQQQQPSQQVQQQQPHGLISKMEPYGSSSAPQPPAPSALPKPDSSLGGFSSSVPNASSMVTTASQVKSTSSPASYPYGTGYAPSVNTSTQPSTSGAQPAGAYPSSSQPTTGGVYNNSGVSSAYQTPSSQSSYGTYAQQQQQQPSTYQSYNSKLNTTSGGLSDPTSSVSSLRVDLSSHVTASPTTRPPATTTSTTGNMSKQAGAAIAPVSSSLPNLPPGVPTVLGPGGFIMGQAPGLPYYAAAASIQQHPVYSLEDMQFRYPHLAGYYDMGYQSPTSLSTGREGTLASLAYAGSDAKFPRNDNSSPVPTSLSQNAAQSHGGAFITPAPAAAAALPPAYAYYYSGGVMPGSYQFGAPAALYPVSAAASGHAASGAAAQYGKGGPLGGGAGATQTGQTTVGSSGGGPSTGTASYASYGSTYDDFSKSVYGSVGVGSAAGQAAKIGGVGASTGPSGVGAAGSADLGVGPTVYGKSHSQLGKINTYDKPGGFHTGTPPPYGLAGSATGAPLGVGVSVGVGGPSPYAAQHMFIPTIATHQSQHSHLNVMHQQLHQDSSSGPGQRSQSGGQQNKPGTKPSYPGSYWGSN